MDFTTLSEAACPAHRTLVRTPVEGSHVWQTKELREAILEVWQRKEIAEERRGVPTRSGSPLHKCCGASIERCQVAG